MEIQKQLEIFLEDAILALRPQEPDIIDYPCPSCGSPVRFPIIARQCDVDAFQKIIKMASACLDEMGITEKLLQAVRERIEISLIVRDAERLFEIEQRGKGNDNNPKQM